MKKMSFELKIAMMTSLISVIIIAGFAFYTVITSSRYMRDEIMKTGRARAEIIAEMSKRALITNDNKALEEIFQTIKNSESSHNITEISLIRNGKYWVHSDHEKTGKIVDDKVILSVINKNNETSIFLREEYKAGGYERLYIVAPVNSGGVVLGSVGIAISMASINQRLRTISIRYLLFALTLGICVMAASMIMTRRALSPLRRLKLNVDILNSSGNVEKLSVIDRDEVGVLTESFNALMDNWQLLYEDLSKRKTEADTQRRLSDAVVQNIANGILVLDHNGRITMSNISIEKHFEMISNAVTGKFFNEVFPGWEGEDTEDIIRRVIETGEMYSNDRIYYSEHNREKEVVFNVRICPMKDMAETILGVVVLFEFMTDKVMLEEHLLRVNEELQRANVIKTEFLSVVSHELRTPLTLIKMYTEMLAKKKLGPLTDKQVKAVEVMNRRCENLNDLISDLLDLSRIESGRLDMHLEEIDLEELVEDIAGIFKPKVRAAGVIFSRHVEPGLPPLYGDRDKLGRVLNNLLENALKFTETGVIRVHVIRDPDRENNALVEVRDTGSGIPIEYQEKIFDKFYQVDGSDTRNHGGTGLGLAIAREIVALHEGRLWLEKSGEGEGSLFRFTVPFIDLKNIEDRKKRIQFTGDGGLFNEVKISTDKESGEIETRRVLLIDDDVDFLDMMTDVLEDDDFKVYPASDGLKALEVLFSGEPVDIILLDVTMPGITGYELCRMIKSVESIRSVPVLMLTASGQSHQVKRGYEAGASGYLVKPFELEIFKKTMSRIMLEDSNIPQAG